MRPTLALALSLALAACGGASSTPTTPDAAAADTAATPDRSVTPDVPVTPDATVTPDAEPPPDAPAEPDVPAAVAEMIRARPYASRVPSTYTAARAWPLVVVLHGYGAAGGAQALYLGLTTAFERRGFLLATPDGTMDASGRRFWNATNACCNFAASPVDDVAYVTAVIDDMSARYRVDPARVYLVGHSNGGFMSHRMACERADRVAGIVSLAGATWADSMRCAPSRPVSVLQVHGVNDTTIQYMGGTVAGGVPAYPSARATVASWARLNRCATTFTETDTRVDYVSEAPGAETRVGRHEGCMGGAAELWTMDATGHIPGLMPNWADAVFDWLQAHAR